MNIDLINFDMGLRRFLIDSPEISQEFIFSEDSSEPKLSILVGGNGCGKTTILSLIHTHQRFFENLSISLMHPPKGHNGAYDMEGSWDEYFNENIILDQDFEEELTDVDEDPEKLDMSNWIFLKNFHWITGGEMDKEWRLEFDYENNFGKLKIEVKHLFYENQIPYPGPYFQDIKGVEFWKVRDENGEIPSEFKGIRTTLNVTLEVDEVFSKTRELELDEIYSTENFVLHTRLYPGGLEPYGNMSLENCVLGRNRTSGLEDECAAIALMTNFHLVTLFLSTKRLDNINSGINPLQFLQYLRQKNKKREFFDPPLNSALRQTQLNTLPIEKIKDAYLFITGEECLEFESKNKNSSETNVGYRINIGTNENTQYLTSGQQHILMLLIQIYANEYLYENEYQNNDTLLILDEIELGLHEEYLEKLSILINNNEGTFPNLIVTTHSPIFAGINIENTFFIDKNGVHQ